MKPGHKQRCAGYISEDHEYAYCTREEHAGNLDLDENTEPATFCHKLYGLCKCSKIHNPERASSNGHTPQGKKAQPQQQKNTTEYSYLDEHGRLAYVAVRYDYPDGTKDFKQKRPDGKGGWIWNLQEVTRIPYRLPELLKAPPGSTVYVCEGEKAAEAAAHLGVIATTNVCGAGKWTESCNPSHKGHHVIILPDNDAKGRDHAQKVAKQLAGIAASVRIVNLPRLPEKGDIVEWIASGGTKERLLQFVDLAPNLAPAATSSKPTTMTLKALMSMQLKPMQWVIPGILPEGLTLLCGKPKLGKSWMGLGIGLDTASGGYALGKKQVERGEVLYLALEDNERRLQSRVSTVLASERYQNSGIPDGIEIATTWPRIGEGGIEQIEQWIGEHPGVRLIIVDTWAKLAPKAQGRQRAQYEEDYEALTPLKALADKHRIAILAVHHLRKMGSEDILDQITGSTGLTGACDGFLVLKRERGRFDAELFVTGRDIEEEQTYKLSFDKIGAIWTLEGNAEDLARGEVQQEILDLLKDYPDGLTVKEAAEYLDNKNFYTTRTLLNRLVEQGKLERIKNLYKCVVSVVSVVTVVDCSNCSQAPEEASDCDAHYTGLPVTTLTTLTTDSFHIGQWVITPKGKGTIARIDAKDRRVTVGFSPGYSASYPEAEVTPLEVQS